MSIVRIQEDINSPKYLVITQQKDPSTLITTRVIITDNANNRINLINIERGPQGVQGIPGPSGTPGRDGVNFTVLPINSGGTNNTSFSNNKIIYYDGTRLSSSNYSINDLLVNNNSITGITVGSGLSKITSGTSSVTINTNIGDGLTLDNNNKIIVSDNIPRKSELSLGSISGVLDIFKGGTNNSSFNPNRLIYFDGNQLTSFPLETGRIVTSGSIISVIAGSGLTGGGSLSIPTGSVVINIGQSQDIFVSENTIELSATGVAGTYTKITTDSKGRVVSGTNITSQDIISLLGYTPWHSDNDGSGSGLDADLLDGKQSDFYLDMSNMTGVIDTNILPSSVAPGSFSKVTVNNKGLVINGENINYSDVVAAIGYRPVSTTGDIIFGDLRVDGDLTFNGQLVLQDNLPIFSANNNNLLPNDPRGFSFVYGNIVKRTGVLAYFPADDKLRLITDIFGSGTSSMFDGGDSADQIINGQDLYLDILDGGNSSTVYLVGNIEGDDATVLMESIADSKYVSLVADQVISGLKTFSQPLSLYNYISIIPRVGYSGPPIYVGSNSGLVTNLNSDLLDNNHGAFYRNAINLTGILNYQTVTVTNLSGDISYLAVFDNRSNNPSRTVKSSIVQQTGSLIRVDDGELSVGGLNSVLGQFSTAIGDANTVNGSNSIAVGFGNVVNTNNSIAINSDNIADKQNSLAMGSSAKTWVENQISIGAFKELDPNNPNITIGRGQHSLTAIGYYGDTSNGYQSLSPTITIPSNKSVLYNIDIMMSKLSGSGVAAFSFSSGIVKNINNSTRVLRAPDKHELRNDSQFRDYTYTIRHNLDNKLQRLSVTEQPLLNNSLEIQNIPNITRLKPKLSTISGFYIQKFNGDVNINMTKPISSGWYTQQLDSPEIAVQSYNHNAATGSMFNIQWSSGVSGIPINNWYTVKSVVDKDIFVVEDVYWSGSYSSGYIIIPSASIDQIDNDLKQKMDSLRG
jgi:hypothetical protein